ncbi:MAG TPA: hypothetical protein VHV53_08595 [Solirubrobacterales bacterium]|nr:hypothetical protein [Solirubrobacterales bacterium]
MKFLRTAVLAGIVIAAVVVLALEPAAGAGTEANVAPCSKAIIGSGKPGWRSESIVAGPVGVAKGALRQMWQAPSGWMYTKMGVLLEGEDAVTVSVPRALRRRVFLYYGRIIGHDGKVTTSFFDARGYGETEFQPCTDKPRTVWPGGLRIRGTAPVHLLVHQGGDAESIPLRLGHPETSGRGAPPHPRLRVVQSAASPRARHRLVLTSQVPMRPAR